MGQVTGCGLLPILVREPSRLISREGFSHIAIRAGTDAQVTGNREAPDRGAWSTAPLRMPRMDRQELLAEIERRTHLPDAVGALTDLLDGTGSGLVALLVAEALEGVGAPNQAAEAYARALGRCRTPDLRERARAALERLQFPPELEEEPGWDLTGLDDEPGAPAADPEMSARWVRFLSQFDGLVVGHATRDARSGTRARIRHPGLHPEVGNAVDRILWGAAPWAHQTRAIEAVLDGEDVILETETASGKSLAYWTAAFNMLMEDDRGCMLYLAPLNALLEDQLRSLQPWGERARDLGGELGGVGWRIPLGEREIVAARFDSTVPSGARPALRRLGPRIIITNPDMLHRSLLLHHERAWWRFIPHLRLVVLDEMHVYRGMFGANVANTLRRLNRLCRHHGTEPRYVACSASSGNAEAQFERLVGRRATTVIRPEDSAADRHVRHTAVIDSARLSGRTSHLASEVLRWALDESVPAIGFMHSISEVDEVYALVARHAEALGLAPGAVRQFKRELPTEDKARVTAGLRTGEVRVVVTSSALRLGIDIGDLGLCLVNKFPESRANLMQQFGRAGRQKDGIAVLIADASGVDQYYAARPDTVLSPEPEDVPLDPDNLEVIKGHLLAAATELPFDEGEEVLGPLTRTAIDELVGDGRLRRGPPVSCVNPGDALNGVQMRGTVADCPVYDGSGACVARPDILRAQRFYHRKALFRVQDVVYQVDRLVIRPDWTEASAQARRVRDDGWQTWARHELDCQILAQRGAARSLAPGATVAHGLLRVSASVPTFVFRHPSKPPVWRDLGDDAPPPYRVRVDGLWIDLVHAVWSQSGGEADPQAGLRSAAEALRLGAALRCATDPSEIGLHLVAAEPGGPARIYVTDLRPGDGVATTVFEDLTEVLRAALGVLDDCPHCRVHAESSGCPQCVSLPWAGPEAVDREGGIGLLRRLRATGDASS